jgi:hypothetical protein
MVRKAATNGTAFVPTAPCVTSPDLYRRYSLLAKLTQRPSPLPLAPPLPLSLSCSGLPLELLLNSKLLRLQVAHSAPHVSHKLAVEGPLLFLFLVCVSRVLTRPTIFNYPAAMALKFSTDKLSPIPSPFAASFVVTLH